MRRRLHNLIFVAALTLTPLGAYAAPSQQTPVPVGTIFGPNYEQTQKVADDAQKALEAGGLTALAPLVPELEEAVLRRPIIPHQKSEMRGNTLYYFASNLADYLAHAVPSDLNGHAKEVVWVEDPYPRAALYLGSYYNETSRPADAIVALDKGLSAAPHNVSLLSEKGAALIAAHRWAEALTTYRAGLDYQGDLLDKLANSDRARLLRGQGFCLTELGRLDEAEASYRESLKIEPNHGGAMHELAYIQGLRNGATPTQTGLVVGSEARKKEPSVVPKQD
jgi:tetratricopeptide (TPR) repeat protein